MKNNLKTGFTLIELLAVIVILAVIALIATPMILGVIEQAKESSAESSALGYIDAVEKTISINMLDSTKEDILDGVYEIKDLSKYQIQVKGEIPSSDSWLKIENNEIVDYSFKIGEYVVSYNLENNNRVVTKDGEIKTKPNGVVKSGPIKEEATSTDTHKGIVYLDPTDLTKTCTKEMAENNLNENGTPTEIKTGCMKWYIYSEDDNNYTMILDHNTTAVIKWSNDNKNVAYESSNLYAVVEDLKTTSGWVVSPRLISAEEINTITGSSKYAWLYDNSYACEDAGCNINDDNTYTVLGESSTNNVYGYWTSTTFDAALEDGVWCVWGMDNYGYLGGNKAVNEGFGIRPVITIPKSIIS